MAALAAEDPLHAEPLGLGVDLGVEPLAHLVRGEEPEVAALGRVGAPGVVQAELLEQHEVAHAGVRARIGEQVARRRHEEDLGALPVEGRLDPLARDRLDVVEHVLQVADDGVRLKAQVVALHVAVRDRTGDPFDVQAQQVQQLAADDGDLRLVDAVGAEDRAAAALGALVEVVPPLLQHIEGQVARAGHLAQDLAGGGELPAVDRAEQFGAQHRHVLRIPGADEEVALVRAGAAAHADVHEEPEGTVFLEAVGDALEQDLLPVLGELPVRVSRPPLAGVRESDDLQALWLRAMAVHPGLELDGSVHPVGRRDAVRDLRQFGWFRKF